MPFQQRSYLGPYHRVYFSGRKVRFQSAYERQSQQGITQEGGLHYKVARHRVHCLRHQSQ